MDTKYFIPVLMGIVLFAGILASSVSAVPDIQNPVAAKVSANVATLKVAQKILTNEVDIKNPIAEKANEVLQSKVPGTWEQTKEIIYSKMDMPHKFVLWDVSGRHVMWSEYGNGYFVGHDNHDKDAWGVYMGIDHPGNATRGKFVGFYDGKNFEGNYFHRGNAFHLWNWNALNLFGETVSHGNFVLFN